MFFFLIIKNQFFDTIQWIIQWMISFQSASPKKFPKWETKFFAKLRNAKFFSKSEFFVTQFKNDVLSLYNQISGTIFIFSAILGHILSTFVKFPTKSQKFDRKILKITKKNSKNFPNIFLKLRNFSKLSKRFCSTELKNPNRKSKKTGFLTNYIFCKSS